MRTGNKTTFALTGATGLLGRNLLLEIIKQHYRKISDIEILLLGRSTKANSLHERVMKILDEEVIDYIDDASLNKSEFLKEVSEKIECFDIRLGEANLSLSQNDYKILTSKKIDFFFHVAALTDFRSGNIVADKLTKINVDGTRSILELLPNLKVAEFSHVSSAYVCGITAGKISPDYINPNQKFRNYYEQTKLEAEILVKDFCKKHRIKFRIFRPSTISGRLIEKKIGATPKFDVFYGWAIFFLRQKEKLLKSKNFTSDFAEINLRFCASNDSGLNIVPVDFAAKIMYQVSMLGHDEESFYLTNKEEVSHRFYFFEMLNFIGIKGVEMVDRMPSNLNKAEDFYYKTVGKIYTPYITCPVMDFDTDNLKDLSTKIGLECPKIDRNNFLQLMIYAKEKNFGLS